MQKCSDAFSCWLYAHTPPVWLSITVMVIAFIALICWFVIDFRTSLRVMKEERQAREAGHRERRMRAHRLWSLIRQCEEWEVDTTKLKDAIAEEHRRRAEARKIDRYRILSVVPFMIVLIVTIIMMSSIPPTNVLWIFYGIFNMFSFAWFFAFATTWTVKRRAFIAKHFRPAIKGS